MKDEKKDKNNKVGNLEKISLILRKKWLVNGTKTSILVVLLIAIFMGLNFWIQKLELPTIDVTQNKIHTLSDASKSAIQNINQDIKIYLYGIEEKSSFIDFIKQYIKVNEKISYEILTEESNLAKVQEYELSEGYSIIVIESGESKKVIDPSIDFSSYDYTTYQQIDITEQVLTNSILGLVAENKPKVYFVQGHGEYAISEVAVLATYLSNESFEVNELNIFTNGLVPEDCDVLAIVSPTTDLLDAEVSAITDYINKGGNIFFTMDVVSEGTNLLNFQTILDLYGVKFENGYIVENDSNFSAPNQPNIFVPQLSDTNIITQDIFTDSGMWLVFSGRLNFSSEQELESMKVTKEDLMYSTENSSFITDLTTSMVVASTGAETGSSVISSLMTKTIDLAKESLEESTSEEIEEDASLESKLVIIASGSFISDYKIDSLSSSTPLSMLGSNKDFAINSIAYLGDKEGGLTIRKDMASATYMPTEVENRIVLAIIFIVPVLIIVIGIIVWSVRKKRR